MHDGTTQPALDTSQGLVSALGGQDAQALEYAGAEIMPTLNGSGTGMILQEPNEANPTDPQVSWVSHPAAIGYRRAGTDDGSVTEGELAAVTPEFDSGMNEGTTGEELQRVGNFYTGSEENPTSAQSAPTPRGEQQTSGVVASGAVPPAADRHRTASWIRAMATNPHGEPVLIRYSGHGYYNPFAGWGWPSWWPFGGGGGAPGGGTSYGTLNGQPITPSPPLQDGVPASGSLGGSPGNNVTPGPPPPPPPTAPPLSEGDDEEDDEPEDGSQVPEPYTPAFPGGKMPKTDMNGNAIMGDPSTDAAPGSQIVPDTPPGEGDTGQGSWDEPGGDAIIGADDPGDTSWDAGNGDGGYSLASDIFTRAMGGLQAVGGLGAAMAGGALIIAPEPVLTKVGGGVLAAVGVDNYLAGMNTLLYGKPQRTVTAAAVSGLAQKAGMDGKSANNLGEGTNNALMILGPAKAGMILKEAAAAGLGAKAANAPKSISTGRTAPKSLKEQLAMEEVVAKTGGKQLPIKMSDTANNLLAEDGWVKMAQNVNGVEIHYVKNTRTGQVVDFKFKD